MTRHHLEEDLFDAIEEQDQKKIYDLIKAGCDVNGNNGSYFEDGISFLMYAASLGNLEIVKLLVQLGANVNGQSNHGSLALFSAAFNGFQDIIDYLEPLINPEIREDVKKCLEIINLEPDEQEVLLYNAIHLKDIKQIKKVIQDGVNLNGSFFLSENTPLVEAICEGDINIVRLLLEAGADPGNGKYDSTLYYASAIGDIDMIKMLLNAGAKIEKTDNAILSTAVQDGHFDVVKILIELGIDVNSNSEYFSYPLLIAAEEGHQEIFDYLLPLTSMDIRKKAKFEALLLADLENETAWNLLREVEPKFTPEDEQHYFENYW